MDHHRFTLDPFWHTHWGIIVLVFIGLMVLLAIWSMIDGE